MATYHLDNQRLIETASRRLEQRIRRIGMRLASGSAASGAAQRHADAPRPSEEPAYSPAFVMQSRGREAIGRRHRLSFAPLNREHAYNAGIGCVTPENGAIAAGVTDQSKSLKLASKSQ